MATVNRDVNPFDVINYPAITVPAGYSRKRLPMGLQTMARPWEDAKLLSIAYLFEQATRVRRAPRLWSE